MAVGVDPGGDERVDTDDAATLADFQQQCVGGDDSTPPARSRQQLRWSGTPQLAVSPPTPRTPSDAVGHRPHDSYGQMDKIPRPGDSVHIGDGSHDREHDRQSVRPHVPQGTLVPAPP